MNPDLLQWFLVATLLAVFLILYSKRQLQSTAKNKLNPHIQKTFSLQDFFNADISFLKKELLKKDFKILYCDKEESKLILESKGIGLFHWGFLFFININETTLDIGIFGKGPNPPGDKTLEKHLKDFIGTLQKLT